MLGRFLCAIGIHSWGHGIPIYHSYKFNCVRCFKQKLVPFDV